MNRRIAGFTLVEMLLACAVVGILASVALPSYRGHLMKARRADAVAALTQVQALQERRRTATGAYAASFVELPGAGMHESAAGLYALAIEPLGPQGYRAVATPATGRSQERDTECSAITLDVDRGFTRIGPSPRCWNR